MKLPTVYICFQQMEKETPTVEAMKDTKDAAKRFCVQSDFIPKSGAWFYKPYVQST